jgi:hypothetical protein
MGRDLLIPRLSSLRALSAGVACLIGASGLGCQRKADVAADRQASAPRSAPAQPSAPPAAPSVPEVPKRGSCHRVGPLACEEAPAAPGAELVSHLNACLAGYRELDYGRIAKVTGAERLDQGVGMPDLAVGQVAAFAVTAQFGAGTESRTARSVYLAAQYGDGLCLVDQLMFPRDPALPCREQFRFRWRPTPDAAASPVDLIVETETACTYASGTSVRCASAEYRVTDGKFWIVRETDRKGACNS